MIYADDTIGDIQEGLARDIDAVSKWLNLNQLILNLTKGNYPESVALAHYKKLERPESQIGPHRRLK